MYQLLCQSIKGGWIKKQLGTAEFGTFLVGGGCPKYTL